MRTTIDINAELFKQAKAYAARQRLTFRALVEDALRSRLKQPSHKPPRQVPKVPVYSGSGLRPGVDLTNNAALLDLLDAES